MDLNNYVTCDEHKIINLENMIQEEEGSSGSSLVEHENLKLEDIESSEVQDFSDQDKLNNNKISTIR